MQGRSERNTAVIASSLILILATICTGSQADEPKPASPEVVARYKAIFEGLADGYASIHGKDRSKALDINQGKPTGEFIAYEYEFFRTPERLLVEELKYVKHTPEDEFTTQSIGLTSVCNTKSRFTVFQEFVGGPFQLASIGTATDADRGSLRRAFSRNFYAPFDMKSLALLLDNKDWTMQVPVEVEREGKQLIKLVLSRDGLQELKNLKAGVDGCYISMMVDPALNFTVQSYSFVLTRTLTDEFIFFSCGTIAYEKNPMGLPIPKSIFHEEYREPRNGKGAMIQLANGEKVFAILRERITYDFDQFDFDPKPAAFFEITAFGLTEDTEPKPISPPVRKRTSPKSEEPPKGDKPK